MTFLQALAKYKEAHLIWESSSSQSDVLLTICVISDEGSQTKAVVGELFFSPTAEQQYPNGNDLAHVLATIDHQLDLVN